MFFGVETVLSLGSSAFLDFLIVGFTIFMVVKFINRLNKKAEDPSDKFRAMVYESILE